MKDPTKKVKEIGRMEKTLSTHTSDIELILRICKKKGGGVFELANKAQLHS